MQEDAFAAVDEVSQLDDGDFFPLGDQAQHATGLRPATAGFGFERAVERVRNARVSIHRQITALPRQIQQWRAMATEFNVDAALSPFPHVQAALFAIADAYQRMAQAAERYHDAYQRRR